MIVDHYRKLLFKLLPSGQIWRTEPSNFIFRLMTGLAKEPKRVHQKAEAIIREGTPLRATDSIDSWEHMYGVGKKENSPEQRREAIRIKVSEGRTNRAPRYTDTVLNLVLPHDPDCKVYLHRYKPYIMTLIFETRLSRERIISLVHSDVKEFLGAGCGVQYIVKSADLS